MEKFPFQKKIVLIAGLLLPILQVDSKSMQDGLISKGLGDPCTADSDCKQTNSFCDVVTSTCVCGPDYVASSDGTACLLIRNDLGSTCQEDIQCTSGQPGPGSECGDDGFGLLVCRCKDTAIGENNICYGIRKLGEPCEITKQCTSGPGGEYSVCVDMDLGKICQCKPDAAEQDGKCFLTSGVIGEECEVDSQCLAGTCVGNVCTCGVSEVPSSDLKRCLVIVDELGQSCEEDVQCQAGSPGALSQCSHSGGGLVCTCNAGAFGYENKCKGANYVGETCEINAQCTLNIGEFGECVENICVCKSGSEPNPGKTKCIPVNRNTKIGKPCINSNECAGDSSYNSICGLSGICICREGFIPAASMDDCLPVVDRLGESCSEPQQCQQGALGIFSDCVNNDDKHACACTDGTIHAELEHKCLPKAQHVGDPCQSHEQCMINLEVSHCLDGFCRCLYPATASSDNSRCIVNPTSLTSHHQGAEL